MTLYTYDFEGPDESAISGAAMFKSAAEAYSVPGVPFATDGYAGHGIHFDGHGGIVGHVKDGWVRLRVRDAERKTIEVATVPGSVWRLDHEVFSDGILLRVTVDGQSEPWPNGVFLPGPDSSVTYLRPRKS